MGNQHDAGAPAPSSATPELPIATAPAAALAESALLAALRGGDEAAFAQLVRQHQPGLRRVAAMYAPDTVVDEIVQDTWAAVITGLSAFEGRSSLKTWIYAILLNQARRRGAREGRTVPFSSRLGPGERRPSIEPDRLVHPELGRGYWPAAPPAWHDDPEGRLLAGETLDVVRAAIAELPDGQREVVTLRDVEGWDADEVCDLLHLSSVNQRVLLHRARTTIRHRLEEYLGGA